MKKNLLFLLLVALLVFVAVILSSLRAKRNEQGFRPQGKGISSPAAEEIPGGRIEDIEEAPLSGEPLLQ